MVAGAGGRGSQTVAHIPHECSGYLTEVFPKHLHIPIVHPPSPAWLRVAVPAAGGCA